MNVAKLCVLPTATAIAALCSPAAMAQSSNETGASASSGYGEIIVTARKREESLLDVPAVISAVSAEQIADYNLNSVEDFASQVPQLLVSTDSNGGQGILAMRGVSTGANVTAGDQAVAINVDSVQVGHAIALAMGQFDLAQVEVLKGPQALFFGKNSPGGVITLRSADPTPDVFTQLRTGYEFNGKGKFLEAIASGPLSDTIGARVVGYVHDQKGYFRNVANEALAGPIVNRNGPDETKYFGRLTLTFKPSSSFDARLKASYYKQKGDPYGQGTQAFNCLTPGVNPIQPSDDCKMNETFVSADPGELLLGIEPLWRDGKPYRDTDAFLASLEMNLHTDIGTLTSVTGYFDSGTTVLAISSNGAEALYSVDPKERNGFDFASDRSYRTLSQELRFDTKLDSPLNFLAGVFFDDTKYYQSAAGETRQLVFGRDFTTIDGKTFSAFGQIIADATPTLQLTVGGRYTHEKKSISGHLESYVGKPFPAGTVVLSNPPSGPFLFNPDTVTSNNFSPEITARWQPNKDLTFFASYKHGYKSGGFDLDLINIWRFATTQERDQTFNEENVKGGEGGVKASLAGGRVLLNLAAYYYKYRDLQVSYQPPGEIGVTVQNAGRATVKGVEFEGTWHPDFVDGLTLTGSAALNSAKYTKYESPCYRLQTEALGCLTDATGRKYQDQAGKRLERAPKWTASAGFRYETEMSDAMGFRLNGQVNYSSSYLTEGKLNPQSEQKSFATVDAGVAVFGANKAWELALIGRNITNKIVAIRSTEDSASIATETMMLANASAPRTITVQLTLRPSELF